MDENLEDIQEVNEVTEDTELVNDIPEDEPVSDAESTEEPEISIKDGEVKFSDNFFDDVPEDKASDEENYQKGHASPAFNDKKAEPVNYYSDDDLQNIPASQWDKSRMPDEVKRYYEAFLRQQEAINRQQEIQENAKNPPAFLNQPKQLTPKELHEEALKSAVQKLGLTDPDDFDIYEGEHSAALAMARQEILQKNAAENADYQRKVGEYKNWQIFSGQLAAQSDFNEFHQWYLDEVKKNGNTPEQISAGLKNLADIQGFGAVQNVWAEFYRQFRSSEFHRQFKTSKTQAQNQPVQRTRAKTPPTLESTQGGNSNNRKVYNMREFGNLDEDAQVQALMDMGIV